jgi:hypothetical protein
LLYRADKSLNKKIIYGLSIMLTRILLALRTLWRRMTGNPFQGVMIECISDEDLQFDPDIDRLLTDYEFNEAFRSFGSLEEYNKEFVTFFKSHRRRFLLDYSQRDGHFRV